MYEFMKAVSEGIFSAPGPIDGRSLTFTIFEGQLVTDFRVGAAKQAAHTIHLARASSCDGYARGSAVAEGMLAACGESAPG